MSRLSELAGQGLAALRETLRVGLYGDGLAWARLRRWPRQTLTSEKGVADAPAACDWRSLLDLLPPELPRGSATDVRLSCHHLRLLVLPWSPTIVTERQTETLARALFEERFGLGGAWTFRFGPAAFGRPRLACAVETALIEALRQRFGRQVGVAPMIAGFVNHRRRQLSAGRQVVIEADSGRFAGLAFEDGHCRAAVSQPLGGDGAEIDRWLRRIGLEWEAPAKPQVWLQAPGLTLNAGLSDWAPRRLDMGLPGTLPDRLGPILIDPTVVSS